MGLMLYYVILCFYTLDSFKSNINIFSGNTKIWRELK